MRRRVCVFYILLSSLFPAEPQFQSADVKDDDEETYLDLMWSSLTTYLSEDFFPPTVSACTWSWSEGRCVRIVRDGDCGCEGGGGLFGIDSIVDGAWYRCAFDYKFGDIELSRACRLQKVQFNIGGDEIQNFFDPSDCPADEKLHPNAKGFCPVSEKQKTEFGRAVQYLGEQRVKVGRLGRSVGKRAVCALEAKGDSKSLPEKGKRALKMLTEKMKITVDC